jgi:hypothetical protein
LKTCDYCGKPHRRKGRFCKDSHRVMAYKRRTATQKPLMDLARELGQDVFRKLLETDPGLYDRFSGYARGEWSAAHQPTANKRETPHEIVAPSMHEAQSLGQPSPYECCKDGICPQHEQFAGWSHGLRTGHVSEDAAQHLDAMSKGVRFRSPGKGSNARVPNMPLASPKKFDGLVGGACIYPDGTYGGNWDELITEAETQLSKNAGLIPYTKKTRLLNDDPRNIR